MNKPKVRVAVTTKLPDTIETRIMELFDGTLRTSSEPISRQELAELASASEVLIPTITDAIDEDLLNRAGPQLKLIANYGAGFDHIDIRAAHRKKILVTNTPGVVTEDTADMTIGLIIAVARRLKEGMRVMQAGGWSGWEPTAYLGARLGGKRLGILGMGRIGCAVAKRARAFGMQIHYHNRHRVNPKLESELEATYWESLDQMVSRMDVISVNCPHTPSTYHLINERRMRLMKRTAVIVNTSRGEVIDQNALTRLLRADALAGAGLDVFEKGVLPNPRLLKLENVVLLPHQGSATYEAREEMGEKVILNVQTFSDGHQPPDLVLPSMV